MLRPSIQPTSEVKPLNARLTIHLRLPGIDYAPDYYMHPADYLDPNWQRKVTKELATLALEAVNSGQLTGRLALEYLESDMFMSAASASSSNTVYHGTPYDLMTLHPQQAVWHPLDRNKPYKFTDEEPAICASPTTAFPAMRAVLHQDHPELANQPLGLRKGVDANGRTIWFTSEEALAAITEAETTGKVYALPIHAPNIHEPRTPAFNKERDEYRIYGSRDTIAGAVVGADALPPELAVVPADAAAHIATLRRYDHVVQWADAKGVPLRSLGGYFPTAYAS